MTPNTALNTVGVIELGYIDLPSATVLAQPSKTLIGVDGKQPFVGAISDGRAPFAEDGLDTEVGGVVAQGSIRAHVDPPKADAYIVSVHMPSKATTTLTCRTLRRRLVPSLPDSLSASC